MTSTQTTSTMPDSVRVLSSEYAHVAPALLREHPDNPRRGDTDIIAESITVNGFFGALVAQRSTGFILAGNHRFRAAKRLGLDAVPVVYVDVDDEHARRILLADNRTSDMATYDDEELARLLLALKDDTVMGLVGTGFDDEALQALLVDAGGGEGDGVERGADLEAVDVLADNPTHECTRGDVWRVGPHVLYVVDLLTGWAQYMPALVDPAVDLLVPYPGILVPLTKRAERSRLVMVQGDPWLAGHLLDAYANAKGGDAVERVHEGAR